MNKIIEPSLLALDKNNAFNQLNQIKELGLKLVHYDVMDNEFIGHTSYKTEYLDYLKENKIYANVHLMVANPLKWIPLYKPYLVNAITFHCETQSIEETKDILNTIHKNGFKAGIAIKMSSDLNKYKSLNKLCDIITIMSVEPGLGGQKFSLDCLHNLKVCKEWKKTNPNLIVQIDGGINGDNMKDLYQYVDYFITGSWFFKNIDKIPNILQELKNIK